MHAPQDSLAELLEALPDPRSRPMPADSPPAHSPLRSCTAAVKACRLLLVARRVAAGAAVQAVATILPGAVCSCCEEAC